VRFDDDTVCEYKFTYDGEGTDATNIAIANAPCPPVNVAAYSIVGIIIATFLLGLIILMVVKVNMTLADKREFAKFEEERKQHTEYICESPIYKSPITTFRNESYPQNGRESQNVFFELK
jgi:integrin beta 1